MPTILFVVCLRVWGSLLLLDQPTQIISYFNMYFHIFNSSISGERKIDTIQRRNENEWRRQVF